MFKSNMTVKDLYNWTQETPEKQLLVIKESIDICIMRLAQGEGSKQVTAMRVSQHVSEIADLRYFLKKGSW